MTVTVIACPVCDEAVTSLRRETITEPLPLGADLLNPDSPSSPFVGHIVTGHQICALPCGDLLTEAQAQALETTAARERDALPCACGCHRADAEWRP